MIDDLLKDAKDRMHKGVEATRHEFGTIRTGRATPSLLDRIVVDYYGAPTPLKQLGNIAVAEARTLTIQAYDQSSVAGIEKAIMESDLGLSPATDGTTIRLSIPELTEDRRKEMVKVARGLAEDGRVRVRNVRRDVMHDLRELKNSGDAGEDDERRGEAELQKLTDECIAQIDDLLKHKEEEMLEV